MKSLFDLYREHQGKVSDKWSIYLAEYERLFSSCRERPVRMLEIGIQNGGSLEIWSKYFPSAQALIGCDINQDCASLTYGDSRIKVVVGDANTDTTESVILSHSANFDLIIDDGSHTSSDIAKSFARYFRHLNDGGLFVAEDLHCSYWQEFEGGLYYPYSSMAFFKRLADVVNHEHWGIEKARRQLLRGFSEKFSIEFDEDELARIHSIEFFNSVCVVRKHQARTNVLGERFIAGQHDLVVSGLHHLSGSSQTPSQANNSWAVMILAPEEALEKLTSQIFSLRQEIAERDGKITNLRQEVAERNEQFAAIVASSSWRITRPFRFVVRGVREVRQTVSKLLTTPSKGKRLGRFAKNIFIAVRGELRRHGILGFSKRVPYYLRRSGAYVNLLASRPLAVDGGLFKASAPIPRDIRLHPDLAGNTAPIDHSVSVVIPTLNAGSEFGMLLRKLRSQRGLRQVEIVVVDSGSQDETVELAKAAGCTVVEIPAKDFTHSYARNSGADAASGDYLLFMVQDAYPIGDYWIYGILRYLLDHSGEKLVAASCAEYSRADSDMMYDSMINTHYRFLGCLDYDRIGEYKGDDHMSLRSYGQLSDVSCLMSRTIFARYRYRGNYAEDLDLGIRLIKDGYRVAMLASVKVIHSHNRPAFYYMKRSFVDVFFLVNLFDDFTYLKVESPRGLIVGIVSVASHLSNWISRFDENNFQHLLHDEFAEWIGEWRSCFVEPCIGSFSKLGDPRLDAYIDSLAERFLPSNIDHLDKAAQNEMRHFLDVFLSRLEHFKVFISGVYSSQDALLRSGVRDAVLKTFGATVGSALAFMYLGLLETQGVDRDMSETIANELKAGV